MTNSPPTRAVTNSPPTRAVTNSPPTRGMTDSPAPPGMADSPFLPVQSLPVAVRRSARRTRTVSARRDGNRIVIDIPARFTPAQEREWVDKLVAQLARKEKRTHRSDAELAERARRLSAAYFGGAVTPTSVRWVSNQGKRWGSCTPSEGTVRISDRLRGMPAYVLDYVIVHELTHFVHLGHTAQFWELVGRYEHAERARGFLQGVSFAGALGMSDE